MQFDAGQITLIDKNDPRYKLTITGKGSASFVRDALDLAIEAVESVEVPLRPDRASVVLRLTPEENPAALQRLEQITGRAPVVRHHIVHFAEDEEPWEHLPRGSYLGLDVDLDITMA